MMHTTDLERAAYSTFTIALLVVILVTVIIPPSRLPLLLIPASFLLASYGMGLLLDVPGLSVISGRYHTRPTRSWQAEPVLQLTPSLNNAGADELPAGSKYA